ncbi:HNH endonuclease signature motif containing protein [Goekera deserti]|uniref:HNH endonuclease n=1 Tax=Goekera deserti TaxID=2497753 RepID=A0A7K3WHB9_9ACTN|nr:HNH endonuclease signature motif containing protein [Goekera deserti]NDI47355.1 DUF222 domain-containing protein [Goekera deserti]NEL55885.1 HNH endonuclease [Goekera deserti]
MEATAVRLGLELGVALAADPVPDRSWSPSRVRISDAVQVHRFGAAAAVAELGVLASVRAELAAYEAALVERLAALRPALPPLPGDDADWLADTTPDDVDDWVVEEVQLATGSSRSAAARTVELSLVLCRQLPATWAALADGLVDLPRARAIADALGHQAASAGGPVPDDVVAGVEQQALGWARAGETPGRLKERTAAAVISADAAAADRRRQVRERAADVRVRTVGDGMSELVVDLPSADAAACRAAVDGYARQWKADGDPRPIGQLRTLTTRDLLTRPWDERSALTAVLVLHADLTPTGAGSPTGTAPRPTTGLGDTGPARPAATGVLTGAQVDGAPVTPAQVADLLSRLAALPEDLSAPGAAVVVGCTDPDTGELRAVATPRDLRRAAAAGTGLAPPPPTDRYRPTPAQRRFVTTRDRTCRFPGCTRPARATDIDHVHPHAEGGPTDVNNLASSQTIPSRGRRSIGSPTGAFRGHRRRGEH